MRTPSMATMRSPGPSPARAAGPSALDAGRAPAAIGGCQNSKPRPRSSSAGSVRWRRCSASGSAEVQGARRAVRRRARPSTISSRELTASSSPQHHVALAGDRARRRRSGSHRRSAGRQCAAIESTVTSPTRGRTSSTPFTQNMPHSTQHGEQDVEGRTGQQHRDALPGRAARERARQLVRRHRSLALIEQLHVAAERNGGDHVLDPVGTADPLQQRLAEAHREAQYLEAEAPRHRDSGRTRAP